MKLLESLQLIDRWIKNQRTLAQLKNVLTVISPLLKLMAMLFHVLFAI